MSHRRWGGAETNDSCHAYDRGLTELTVKGWQIVQGPALALALAQGTAQRINTGIFLSSNELLPAKNGKKWQTVPPRTGTGRLMASSSQRRILRRGRTR